MGDTDPRQQQQQHQHDNDDDTNKSTTTDDSDGHSEPAGSKHPLEMKVEAQWGPARAGRLKLPHFECETPIFMPVGTQGTVKGLTVSDLEEIGCGIVLGNTYHLGHRPGGDVIEALGGLHKFMNWKRNLLTDSGGFQMVSLSKLSKVTEEGVYFQSPHDGTMMTLTPEHSMHIQNQIGADIMMALDDVVSSTTTGPRVEEAMNRTIRWLRRCVNAHANPKTQNLFGIVQGGLDPNLREQCLQQMTQDFDLPGFAIGGLSGGESKEDFWKVVYQCTAQSPHRLPANKPRYLMGVGYAVDLVVCVALGVDMFDCVYPSRTARFGTALVDNGGEGFGSQKGGKLMSGQMHLKQTKYQHDYSPIDKDCPCFVCKKYTRAYLHTVAGKEGIGSQLLTYHNITYQMRLMKRMRNAIVNGTFDTFVKEFMLAHFPNRDYPSWTVNALQAVGILLT